jgi:hypothetical protein
MNDVSEEQLEFEMGQEGNEKRALIDELISETRLYSSAQALKELFEFTAQLREIAPFNAMLLHIQKPGVSHVATSRDWMARFGCRPKPHARPLVVLRNFGPVDFVYDILDVEGGQIPEVAHSFPTAGTIPDGWIQSVKTPLARQAIYLELIDEGDLRAGRVWASKEQSQENQLRRFEVRVNRNHGGSTQFVSLVHELAHLFLGHCGADVKRKVRGRETASEALREVEAESVAWIVARRSGVRPRSDAYLDRYQGSFDEMDLHAVMTAAGRIEKLLHLPPPDSEARGG